MKAQKQINLIAALALLATVAAVPAMAKDRVGRDDSAGSDTSRAGRTDDSAKSSDSSRSGSASRSKDTSQPGRDTSRPSRDTSSRDTSRPARDTSSRDTSRPARDTSSRDTSRPARDTSSRDTSRPARDTSSKDTIRPGTDTVSRDTARPNIDTSRRDSNRPSVDTSRKDTIRPGTDTVSRDSNRPSSDISRKDTIRPGSDTVRRDSNRTGDPYRAYTPRQSGTSNSEGRTNTSRTYRNDYNSTQTGVSKNGYGNKDPRTDNTGSRDNQRIQPRNNSDRNADRINALKDREVLGTVRREMLPVPRRNDKNFMERSRSKDGFNFDNGIRLRPAALANAFSRDRIFKHKDYSYYPYYQPVYIPNEVYYSPYYSYHRVAPGFIYREHCYRERPLVIFIDIPVYRNGLCIGFDDNYSSYPRNYETDRAVDSIREAYINGDVGQLIDMVDSDRKVAICRQGDYNYSVSSNDFLDMTRDLFQNIDTVRFNIAGVRRNGSHLTISAVHTYKDGDDELRKTYISFGLTNDYGRWVITQMSTSPDRYDK